MENQIEKLNGHEVIGDLGGINWQQFQEFWKSVTTRPETINKSFSKAYRYEFFDIEEVHHKVMEVSKSYETKAIASNFTAYYADKSKRIFNSFETFEAGVRGTSSATRSITLEYTFIIQHSQTKNCGSYKISIDLVSKLAGDEFSSFPKFMRSFSGISGHVKIEHVDYVVAQNFMNIIKEWFETRKAAKESGLVKFLQKYSDYIPALSMGIFTLIFACVIYFGVDEQLKDTTLAGFAKFIIINLTIVVITREIIYRIGSLVEHGVDSLNQIAFINLTTGDKNLISEFEERNKKSVKKTILFLITEVLVGLLNSAIALTLLR